MQWKYCEIKLREKTTKNVKILIFLLKSHSIITHMSCTKSRIFWIGLLRNFATMKHLGLNISFIFLTTKRCLMFLLYDWIYIIILCMFVIAFTLSGLSQLHTLNWNCKDMDQTWTPCPISHWQARSFADHFGIFCNHEECLMKLSCGSCLIWRGVGGRGKVCPNFQHNSNL